MEPGKPLTTTAAYVRAGRWVVVLRVTGPSARHAEIESGLDALLAGMRFATTAKPLEAAIPTMAAPCPADDERPAKPLRKSKDSAANALVASLFGGSTMATG